METQLIYSLHRDIDTNEHSFPPDPCDGLSDAGHPVTRTVMSDSTLTDAAYRVINGIFSLSKKKCIDSCHSEKNTFLAISSVTVGEGRGNSTALLDMTERVVAMAGENKTIIAASLLSIQSENLPPASTGYFVISCALFFKIADRNDISYVYREITAISNKLVSIGCATSPKSVIRSLMQCVTFQTTQFNSHTLTPSHANLLQALISAQMYTLGAKFVLENPILEVCSPIFLTKTEFLRYFYYAGICLIGICDFNNAIDMLEQAIAVQGNVISAISVCALKKACLISLIHSGLAFELPKHTSSQVKKLRIAGLGVYDDIVQHFTANDQSALLKCIEDGGDTLKSDQNYGIAKQVADALIDHRIRKLTQTYITMSISDISKACQCNVQEVHSRLMKMISNSTINAIMDESSSTVLFRDNVFDSDASDDSQRKSSDASDLELISFLQAHLSESAEMSNKIREMLKSIMLSEEYIKRMSSSTRGPQQLVGQHWADSMDCDDEARKSDEK